MSNDSESYNEFLCCIRGNNKRILRMNSNVEEAWRGVNARRTEMEKIDVVTTTSFPELGKLTAFRFLEFVQYKPDAVVSLPTGKTPEYFIKWVTHISENWDSDEIARIRTVLGMKGAKPKLNKLRFVQMDEFFPIRPDYANSFHSFIRTFYVKEFGLDDKNCLLMDTSGLFDPRIFDDGIDLRIMDCNRESLSELQRAQYDALLRVKEYCEQYESKIREWGGLDFFLGGIGPDGHIAFNIRGSEFDSTTRLLRLNYESMAASAESLGGMSTARKKLVITIGLGTICFKPSCTAVIFAAGEAKADLIKNAVEAETSIEFPSHALRRLSNSVFFITRGAAKLLDRYQSAIPKTQSYDIVSEISKKLNKGRDLRDMKFVHTEPHHDDIMLAYLPFILQSRSAADHMDVFACGTSGFNSVSSSFLSHAIDFALSEFSEDAVLEVRRSGKETDITIFRKGVAESNENLMHRGLALRLIRSCDSLDELKEIRNYLDTLYPGQAPSERVRRLKGICREFEGECLWGLLDWPPNDVRHLRLGFYTGDIFNPQPTYERDAKPVLELLKAENPDYVTLALDPESSGPDTHYKVLQALTAALSEFESVKPNIKIWGYRNVWYRFEFEEADVIIPVSEADMSRTHELFVKCYQTQRLAEFPSPQQDGPFSSIVLETWRQQLADLKRRLGPADNIFDPSITGLVYIKELTVSQLRSYSRSLAGV